MSKGGGAPAALATPAPRAQDEDFVRRFHREARSAAAINHPNATRICSFGEQAGSDHAAEEIQAENGVLGLRRTEFRWQTSAR
jgi:hypothetical protein